MCHPLIGNIVAVWFEHIYCWNTAWHVFFFWICSPITSFFFSDGLCILSSCPFWPYCFFTFWLVVFYCVWVSLSCLHHLWSIKSWDAGLLFMPYGSERRSKISLLKSWIGNLLISYSLKWRLFLVMLISCLLAE